MKTKHHIYGLLIGAYQSRNEMNRTCEGMGDALMRHWIAQLSCRCVEASDVYACEKIAEAYPLATGVEYRSRTLADGSATYIFTVQWTPGSKTDYGIVRVDANRQRVKWGTKSHYRKMVRKLVAISLGHERKLPRCFICRQRIAAGSIWEEYEGGRAHSECVDDCFADAEADPCDLKLRGV